MKQLSQRLFSPWWARWRYVPLLGAVLILGAWAAEQKSELPGPATERVLEFYHEHLPNVYVEMIKIRKEDPEAFKNHLKEAAFVMDEFQYYADFDPDLATMFIEVKRREYQEQLKAEEILRTKEAARQKQLFDQLYRHMDDTYELNLRLFRGETARLEEAIQNLRKTIREEEQNKSKNIKSDLRELLGRKAKLMQRHEIEASQSPGSASKPNLQKLIDALPD